MRYDPPLRAPRIFTLEEIREAAERELAHWTEHGCGTPTVVYGCCDLAQATRGREHDPSCN